ncbi:hypothetical protein KM043_007669 [Ampulex compressa]|nr:hypothetical protein KM043_007669 [Ampulex compressa]
MVGKRFEGMPMSSGIFVEEERVEDGQTGAGGVSSSDWFWRRFLEEDRCSRYRSICETWFAASFRAAHPGDNHRSGTGQFCGVDPFLERSFRLLYENYGAEFYQEVRKSEQYVRGSMRRRGNKRKSHVCPKCGNGYTVVKSLKRHLRYECGLAPRFKCPYCGTRSKQRAHVNEHIRRKHSGQRIYIIDSP